MNDQQIMLPDEVTLTLKTQDVGSILAALEGGAYKVAMPIINSIQGQLLAQQIRSQPDPRIAPPPVNDWPPPPKIEVPQAELTLVEDVPTPAIPNDVLEAISHHPV